MANLFQHNLRLGPLHRHPFAHFLSVDILREEIADSLLAWLETDAPWRLAVEDFYEQYEFSLRAAGLPSHLKPLVSYSVLSGLRDMMATAFSTHFIDDVDITAHKLVKEHSIRIHNDVLDGDATHRLVVHLNRDWSEECGGLLVLFGSEDPADICKIVKPLHNTAFGFEISQDSNHAVSRVKQGQRYSLVYSFKERLP